MSRQAANIISAAKNLEDVREMNLALILKLLQKMKICSRAELSKVSGLRQSTITNIVGELIDCGLVSETGNIEGLKGRRSIGIRLNAGALSVAAVRLARTHFLVGRFDLGGNAQCVERREIVPGTPVEQTLAGIEALVARQVGDSPTRVLGLGISVPGPLFFPEERIAMMTGSSGWEDVRVSDHFAGRFDLPVYVEHDAKAGALAEWWYGPNNIERGTFAYVAAGQGIGAGITVDGKLLRGARGVSCELGHMSINYAGPQCQCGNRGCLENYCSALAMRRRVNEGLDAGVVTSLPRDCAVADIAAAVGAGDAFACQVFQEAASLLGFGLASFVNLYNPGTIIIGDELTGLGEPLLETVRDKLRQHLLPELFESLELRFSAFDHDPALIGAAALTVDKSLRKPSLLLAGESVTA